MKISVRQIVLIIILPLLSVSGARAADEETVTIDTRSGVTVSFVVTRPDGDPKAAAILFVGGNGKLRLWRGRGIRSRNFLVRSRRFFADRGILAVTVDVPSDRRKAGMTGFRGTEEHQKDVAAVVRWIRGRTRAPLWLVGTSRGTVSLGHLTATLPVDGAVFTATVTRSSRRNPPTVFDGDLAGIRVPVLLAHHRNDECRVTPPEDQPELAARLSNAPKVETLLFEGGRPAESQPCRAMSAHGFLGVEEKVVDAITRWMLVVRPRR